MSSRAATRRKQERKVHEAVELYIRMSRTVPRLGQRYIDRLRAAIDHALDDVR